MPGWDITEAALAQLHRERGEPETPELLTKINLTAKGVIKLQNLGAFYNVRCLMLAQNGIRKIDGLERMLQLKTLILSDNCITTIENLHEQTQLSQLDLTNNGIQRLENLRHMTKLQRLQVGKNAIESLEGLAELQELPALQNVDVSANAVAEEEADRVIDFWAGLAHLKVLYFHGNPCVRFVKQYRKRMVMAMPDVSYLDDRPVGSNERSKAQAWSEGGKEAEQKVRAEQHSRMTRPLHQDEDWAERKAKMAENHRRAFARMEAEEAAKNAARAARLDQLGKQPAASTAAPAPAASETQQELETRLEAYRERWRADHERLGPEGLREEVARGMGPKYVHTEAPQHSAAAVNAAEYTAGQELEAARQRVFKSRFAAEKASSSFAPAPRTASAGGEGAAKPTPPATVPVARSEAEAPPPSAPPAVRSGSELEELD